MTVTLEAIKFNHDASSATTNALSIRQSGSTSLPVPEWERGVTTTPEQSRAAYAVKPTTGNTLTIQARFRSQDVKKVHIRAKDPTTVPYEPDTPSGCAGLLLKLLLMLLQALGNVLGDVKKASISFDAQGDSGFVTLPLTKTRLHKAAVGVYTTNWRWEYRVKGQPWKDLATTRHRIYVVLDTPTAPWKQGSDLTDTQLPWTDMLDRACYWALGAKTTADAGRKITEAVFGLGGGPVEYDCPGGGGTRYAWPQFYLTAFLERIDGGYGRGGYVNCSDCATIVATFANGVGCDLWQSRMGYGFDLNPLLAIGSAVWQPACGWSGFSYHEVAWDGGCMLTDHVWDACLKVDGDLDPTAAPQTPMTVAGMEFADYRARLVPPYDFADCAPQPDTKQRRNVV